MQRAGQALKIDPKLILSKSKNVITVEDMAAKSEEEKEWKSLALKFKGHIVSYGCHASAVLVSPEDVTNWTAIEKQKDNMVVCHDFHQLEAQGLLKLDILGLETLDIIEKTKHRAGIDSLNIANIPIDDKDTAEMLRRGNTAGCFQIESNVMTGIVLRMGIKNVEDLSSVVALGRPGPLDSGMAETFLRRRNHQEPTIYDIPDLEPILKDTEGVIVYQEQIMQIAQKICGYSLGEADNLRRIIGRKVKDEMQPVIADMIKRGVQRGYTEKQMKDLTDNIVTFASYGFNHCLSGETTLYRNINERKPLTLEEMYKTKTDKKWAKENKHLSLWEKYNRYGYGYGLSIIDGKIKRNKIVDIFYSGKNYVYEVRTESGKYVKCTANHKFPTRNGKKMLKDLKVGELVYIKGDRVKVSHDYRLTNRECIADNIPKKGQKGFQEKMDSNWYLFEEAKKVAIYNQYPCAVCGKSYDGETRFEMHHKNGDRKDNSPENLEWLCTSCHKKEHYKMGRTRQGGNGYELEEDRIVSIKLIGMESVYDIEMEHPYHTVLVNNGIIVSNSHSVAYGMTAWVTAYLKCHYPAAYWASVIDANCKDKPKLAGYIMDARKDGIKILPPTINHKNCFSDYDEDGPTITLGLNCIAGVGKNDFPKDAPTNFKQFIGKFSSTNKKCLENMVKAGVFKGNRDEMIQYITWYKDKRKSKGEFVYTPTEYNEQEEESKILGISFGNIFQNYNMSIVNNINVFGYEVLNIKARKTKTGKPMAFVKVRDNDYVKDLVIFNDKYKQLKSHKVYIMKVKNNRIFEFTEAKLA